VLFVGAAIVLLGTIDLSAAPQAKKQKPAPVWRYPRRAARKKNPVPADAKSIALGKKLFEKQCLSCHGATGRGDGPAAKDLEVHPGNLSDPKMWEQKDGALFWKIKTGRTPMPSFLTLLTATQRWNIINYVRTLAPRPGASKASGPKPVKVAISDVLKPYFQVVAALGSSDAKQAKLGAKGFVDATKTLASADLKSLEGKDKDKAKAKVETEWKSHVKALQAAAATLAKNSNLADLRASLEPTSVSLADLLRKYGHGERQPVYEFFCPHAMNEHGATWLQLGKDPRNPYMGEKMPTCGKVQEILRSNPTAVKKPKKGGGR